MSKSIMQKSQKCYLCGSEVWLEEHHIFGATNRRISERYGLKVYLCHYCHNEPPYGVHHNAERMNKLQQEGQKAFMEYYHKTKEEFRKIFGRSYI